ncbi:MAG: GNAT family N-acetyltransferase [Pseudomonadota bacterium]
MVDSLRWGGTIRKIWPMESKKFRDHLLRLDADSRRMRFGNAVSDSFIGEYAAGLSLSDGIVFAFIVDGDIRSAAELRKLGSTWSGEAEAAFSVEVEYQNKGIGSELMSYIIRSARNRGVHRLWMSCLAENNKMRALAHKHKAKLEFACGDVIGEITSSGPDFFSLSSEAFDDRLSYVLAAMDLKNGTTSAA